MEKIRGVITSRVCDYSTRYFRRTLRQGIYQNLRSILASMNKEQKLNKNAGDPT